MSTNLQDFGWNPIWDQRYAAAHARVADLGSLAPLADCCPGRVLAEHRSHLDVLTPAGVHKAVTRGRSHRQANFASELPAVGDWLLLAPNGAEQWVVELVLPRTTCFARKVAGEEADAQVVAANVDMAWIVSGLDRDLNPARLQRYLTLVRDSGAAPLLVLTKLDLVAAPEPLVQSVQAAVPDVPVVAISTKSGQGMAALAAHVQPRQTMVLVGSSGVGKSTLLNTLAGRHVMATGRVRTGDGKGRHTTTHRQLVRLASGLLVIDTPGMREVHLWGGEAALELEFRDIAILSGQCRFRDCDHGSEPGCAVRAAVLAAELSNARLQAFLAFRAELRGLDEKLVLRRRARGRGRPAPRR